MSAIFPDKELSYKHVIHNEVVQDPERGSHLEVTFVMTSPARFHDEISNSISLNNFWQLHYNLQSTRRSAKLHLLRLKRINYINLKPKVEKTSDT